MLHIFIFVPAFLSADLPISPSINLVQINSECIQKNCSASALTMGIQPKKISMAISNDGFTPNHLLQQMYGTKDVDIELGDEELELIAGASKVVKSYNSDVIVDGRRIISLNTVLQYENDHNKLIQVIKQQFSAAGIPISDLAAGVLSDQLRHQAPRVGKRQHRGFILNPSNGRLCFLDTPGCSPNFILQG